MESIDLVYHNKQEDLPIDSVHNSKWNTNFVTGETYALIKQDIRVNGFIGPIVVQKFNKELNKENVIINGEHRVKALKELGGNKVPAIILDLPDKKARVLSIRLNREHGELLPNRVSQVLLDLSPEKDLDFLRTETGIPLDELTVLTNMDFKDEDIFDTKHKKKIPKEEVVMCPNCHNEFTLYK